MKNVWAPIRGGMSNQQYNTIWDQIGKKVAIQISIQICDHLRVSRVDLVWNQIWVQEVWKVQEVWNSMHHTLAVPGPASILEL